MSGQFSANPSALGYFYQARYALLLLLKAEDAAEVSVERLEDIAFEQGGTPPQLLQTKHHVSKTALLTDKSVDRWKTLRVWSVALSEGKFRMGETIMTLVTTAKAPEDSVASKLRPDIKPDRDVDEALAMLQAVAFDRRGFESQLAGLEPAG